MNQSLGEKLRAAREKRGISISEVAEQTRISPHYLTAIENEDFKQLPGGIFNKGFIRAYAKFVGVDETEAVRQYSEIVAKSENQLEPSLKVKKHEVLTDEQARQSSLPTLIFAVIILAFLTGGAWFLANYILTEPTQSPLVVQNTANRPASNNVAETPSISDQPQMGNLKIEFRSLNLPISLSAVSDGQKSIDTIPAGGAKTFSPKEKLTLSYSKSLASSARLYINGKEIQLPLSPSNPKRAAIEIEISSSNLGEIWNSGVYSFGQPESNTQTPNPLSTPAQVNSNNTPPAIGESPSPSPTAQVTPRPTAERTPSPKPTEAAKPSPSPTSSPRNSNTRTPAANSRPTPTRTPGN